jgi:hypothetical protein
MYKYLPDYVYKDVDADALFKALVPDEGIFKIEANVTKLSKSNNDT